MLFLVRPSGFYFLLIHTPSKYKERINIVCRLSRGMRRQFLRVYEMEILIYRNCTDFDFRHDREERRRTIDGKNMRLMFPIKSRPIK